MSHPIHTHGIHMSLDAKNRRTVLLTIIIVLAIGAAAFLLYRAYFGPRAQERERMQFIERVAEGNAKFQFEEAEINDFVGRVSSESEDFNYSEEEIQQAITRSSQ